MVADALRGIRPQLLASQRVTRYPDALRAVAILLNRDGDLLFLVYTMLESKNGVADLVKPLRGAYEPSSSLFIARFLAKFQFA